MRGEANKWRKELHQHRSQTATNTSNTFMSNKEAIGRPIPERRSERTEGRRAPEPPGTLPTTRWNQEMMMEQNARRIGRQALEPYPQPDGTRKWSGTECQKNRETSPGTLPTTRWNQEMMMEQNARRIGRQALEPYPQPDGTRKWWWNRMPEE